MKSKADAEAKLATIDLLRPVEVVDVLGEKGEARRRYRYDNPNGPGLVTIEVDADPSPEQLADLATHLPVPAAKRGETLAKLKGTELSPIEDASRRV